jgi:hypothetical protein
MKHTFRADPAAGYAAHSVELAANNTSEKKCRRNREFHFFCHRYDESYFLVQEPHIGIPFATITQTIEKKLQY